MGIFNRIFEYFKKEIELNKEYYESIEDDIEDDLNSCISTDQESQDRFSVMVPEHSGHQEDIATDAYRNEDVPDNLHTVYCYGHLFRIFPTPSWPYSDHIDLICSSNLIISENVQYDLTRKKSILSIAVPQYRIHAKNRIDNDLGMASSLEYLLRIKGDKYWQKQNYDMAIACYGKATQLMAVSDENWDEDDFFLIVNKLKEIGRFDRAKKWEDWLDQNIYANDILEKIENELKTKKSLTPKVTKKSTIRKYLMPQIHVTRNAHHAALIIFASKEASIPIIQNSLKLEYSESVRVVEELERAGVIGPIVGDMPRKILLSQREYISRYKIVSKPKRFKLNSTSHADDRPIKKHQHEQSAIECELNRIDEMDGHTFEHWCARLLEIAGFTDVKVTKKSGDQGVDVLASMEGGVRYAVQCKCYSSDLGNKPVQEVYAGIAIYNCQIGCVMTNRHFTSGAKELAKATGIELWDRDWIISLLKELDEGMFPI